MLTTSGAGWPCGISLTGWQKDSSQETVISLMGMLVSGSLSCAPSSVFRTLLSLLSRALSFMSSSTILSCDLPRHHPISKRQKSWDTRKNQRTHPYASSPHRKNTHRHRQPQPHPRIHGPPTIRPGPPLRPACRDSAAQSQTKRSAPFQRAERQNNLCAASASRPNAESALPTTRLTPPRSRNSTLRATRGSNWIDFGRFVCGVKRRRTRRAIDFAFSSPVCSRI